MTEKAPTLRVFNLPRTGHRPLEFLGERIAEDTTRTEQGPCETRYWRISAYRVEGGGYVLHLDWSSRWQGELAHASATLHPDLEDLAQALERADPLAHLQGFPQDRPGSTYYARRQATLERALTACWQAALSRVLSHLGLKERL